MTDAKLISYTINDFSTEIEMESFLHLMEKHGDEFYKKLKKHGTNRDYLNIKVAFFLYEGMWSQNINLF